MKVLVSGGAGYIGAHVVRTLANRDHQPVILDDFRTSLESRTGRFPVEKVALEETRDVLAVFERHRPDAIIHLGGYISVGESVRDPDRYWNNNLGASLSLLMACARFPIQAFVFSSTAAVYGNAAKIPIEEDTELLPTSPYGASKLGFEQVLHASAHALEFCSIALRYFNASGAHPPWSVGEQHDPEEHLIPRVIRALRSGNPVQVYGNDYPTPDGTCVRDYIHVMDLAEAHVKAIEANNLKGQHNFNVGTGLGHSVLQVIHAIAARLSVTPRIEILSRRPGDPPQLVADPSALISTLGWRPTSSSLEEIISSAVEWEFAHRP
jgi:UDP-glucose-4-epimerase GalE